MSDKETQARLYMRTRWYFHPVLWFLGGVVFFALFQAFIDAVMRWAFL
jgi:hypothetical protein